jgi:hypothetical protein
MTLPSPEPDVFPLGPGTLTIGATGTPIDVSCLVNNAVISADKTEGDSTTKLCGTVRTGSVTYDYTLAGNMDTDVADADGFFALSQTAPGTELDFTFEPNTEAGTVATGRLVVDPLDFGGDTTGETMTSDFEFTVVGQPTYTYGGGVAVSAASSGGSKSKSKSDAA